MSGQKRAIVPDMARFAVPRRCATLLAMPTKSPRHTLANTIRRYRTMSGMSQNELADLSTRLAAEGVVVGPLMQQHLSRLENGVAPMPGTLHTLAVTLAHAMREAGFDEVDADDLHKHLLNANRLHVTSYDVPQEAVELAAILAPLGKGSLSTIIWSSLHAFGEAAVEAARTLKRQQRHNDSQR